MDVSHGIGMGKVISENDFLWLHSLYATCSDIGKYLFIYLITGTLAQRLECSPMARETWVQSQVESYQRL